MLTFTLDHNCVIDIEEARPDAPSVRALADAHLRGVADVAVLAMSASENQLRGVHNNRFSDFQTKLAATRLDHLAILLPLCVLDCSYLDHCLLADTQSIAEVQEIYRTLFPGVTDAALLTPLKRRQRDCDAHGLWSHIHSGRDVFVTRDKAFHGDAKSRLLALGAGRIECQPDAAALL